MATTNFGRLTDEQKTVWSMDFWKAWRGYSFLNRYTGTGQDAIIQKITELTKDERGARAVITLVADLVGDGIAGDRTLEGNEEAMRSYDQVITLDQLRHANRNEGRMAEQKSIVRFREQSRDKLAWWMSDRVDQLAFLTMSGVSYAYKTDGTARVGSDFPYLEFAADVSAPSTNRYLVWDKTGFGVNTSIDNLVGGAIGTGDYPTWEMLVEAKAYAKRNFIRPARTKDGVEVYHVFMHPDGVAKLKQDTNFLSILKEAGVRGDSNVLFKGTGIDALVIDGLAISEFQHVYHPTNSGSVKCQRVLLCGAQAMGFADLGNPMWEEETFDFKNQVGIAVGKILGFKKPKFHTDVTNTVEDFGILAIDTAR